MPGSEEFADRYAGQPAEAAAEANLRAVDEAHWLAMEERLGAEREPVSRERTRATGPGYVAHLVDLSGSGLHACDGRPFDPIPEGALAFPCTGCYVVGPKLAEERKMANLGNATTRLLLAELKARGEMAGTTDGRYLARLAGNLLAGNSALGAELLDYRTVDGRDA
jgi:hypothetical protein